MALVNMRSLFSSLPNDHSFHIIVRTYPLALSLSLGPAILSIATSPTARLKDLKQILRRELGVTAFPFAITVALGGGSALRTLWKRWELEQNEASNARQGKPNGAPGFLARLKPWHKTFISNALASLLAISLLQSRSRSVKTRKVHIPWTVPISETRNTKGGQTPVTLDLTLLVLVRAFDALVQGLIFKPTGDETKQEKRRRLRITTKLDALAFWASSAGFAFPKISLRLFVVDGY
jgi:hypothetical protein